MRWPGRMVAAVNRGAISSREMAPADARIAEHFAQPFVNPRPRHAALSTPRPQWGDQAKLSGLGEVKPFDSRRPILCRSKLATGYVLTGAWPIRWSRTG